MAYITDKPQAKRGVPDQGDDMYYVTSFWVVDSEGRFCQPPAAIGHAPRAFPVLAQNGDCYWAFEQAEHTEVPGSYEPVLAAGRDALERLARFRNDGGFQVDDEVLAKARAFSYMPSEA